MDNDKRSELKVEVPRKKAKLKDTITEAIPDALLVALSAGLRELGDRIGRGQNDRNIELRIDIPKIQFGNQPVDEDTVIDVADWEEGEEMKELE